ncbi:hypothetical protein RHO14_08915 [Orbus wheelerorum]|uniref:hypothetical protein n=1 Tax=Orbus wheelerorum TaxID=3074111 RepID=UPI00370D56A5
MKKLILDEWINIPYSEIKKVRTHQNTEYSLMPSDVPSGVRFDVEKVNNEVFFLIYFSYFINKEDLELKKLDESLFIKVGKSSRKLYQIKYQVDDIAKAEMLLKLKEQQSVSRTHKDQFNDLLKLYKNNDKFLKDNITNYSMFKNFQKMFSNMTLSNNQKNQHQCS